MKTFAYILSWAIFVFFTEWFYSSAVLAQPETQTQTSSKTGSAKIGSGWFRSKNSKVEAGNQWLQKKQPQKAIRAYDSAAKRLPNEPGVHLNRGIALAEIHESENKPANAEQGSTNQLARAMEAFRMATEPPASKEVQSRAFYNLGRALYLEGQQALESENFEQARSYFKQSAEASKSSLKAKPGNTNAGWNLELALRAQQETQKKEQEKKEEQEKSEEQENEEQDESEEQQDEKSPEEQNNEEQNSQDDSGENDENSSSENESEKQQDEKSPEEQNNEEQPSENSNDEENQSPDSKPPSSEDDQTQEPPPQIPNTMQQTLDALKDSEKNLEEYKAKQRALRQQRKVTKDW